VALAIAGGIFFLASAAFAAYQRLWRRKEVDSSDARLVHLLKNEPTELEVSHGSLRGFVNFDNYIPPEFLIARERLTIEQVLGGGAAGVVKAGKIGKSIRVAIKQVNRRLVGTDGAAWWRECEILCRLRHPNTVAFYGFSYDDTCFMFIQELCYGGNLRDAMRDSPGIVRERAKKFMLQIAAGVE
jgi:serine/threonine protein kinase